MTKTKSQGTLGKRFYLFEPLFHHLYNGENNPSLLVGGRNKSASGYKHMPEKEQQLKPVLFLKILQSLFLSFYLPLQDDFEKNHVHSIYFA